MPHFRQILNKIDRKMIKNDKAWVIHLFLLQKYKSFFFFKKPFYLIECQHKPGIIS